jgi:hypothetical protein
MVVDSVVVVYKQRNLSVFIVVVRTRKRVSLSIKIKTEGVYHLA